MSLSNAIRTFALVMLLATTATVAAHEGRPVYIELTEQAGSSVEGAVLLQLQWKVPPVLSAPEYPTIELHGNGCDLVAPRAQLALEGLLAYRCPQGLDGVSVDVSYPQANPALSTLLRYQRLSGLNTSSFTGPEMLRIALPPERHLSSVASEYLVEGVAHILAGYDHLLFVFCLMAIAGTVRRILWSVTGFTVAHSITLGMASANLLHLRIDLVEILIALSIVFLAAEATSGLRGGRANTLTWRYPVGTSVGFGLLHGFGFASALSELGLPQGMQLFGLGFFNLGVELGQLLFVAAVLLAWWLITRVKLLKPHVQSVAALEGFRPTALVLSAAGLLASYWFFERLIGVWAG